MRSCTVRQPLAVVSKGGLEPPCPFGRQPLKLVRLPISPLRRGFKSLVVGP
jgi:hypothetical protein